MKTLFFATAGVPISAESRSTISGIDAVAKLGLNAMELEFVHGCRMKEPMAEEVRKEKEEKQVVLTAHGPYYINLNSKEQEKVDKSIYHIMTSAKIANICGAWSLTFHPGFYLGVNKKQVYEKIRKELKQIVQTIKDNGWNIRISPETTGKNTQFGSIEESISLASEIDGLGLCIDFAHIHARSNGKWNTEQEFRKILDLIEKNLGKDMLNNMHMHVSGIHYSEKGEINHLMLKESDFNYKDLLKVLKAYNVKGTLVCESPNPQADAILLKETYRDIRVD